MDSLPSGALQVLNLVRSLGAEPEQQFPVERECIRGFRRYMRRLEVVLEQINDDVEAPASYVTALEAIQQELIRAKGELDHYQARSLFYALGRCRELNMSLEQMTRSIGTWLLFVPLEDRKRKERVEELAAEMQQASYKATEAEEKCCLNLQNGLNDNAMLAGSLWRDMARLIGLDPETNAAELAEQVQILKDDFRELSGQDMEMKKLGTVLEIFEQVKAEPELRRMYSYKEAMEEAPLEPFESFICPLTRQLMKDPVIIETEITYERSAIERWFRTCKAQGREVNCPVTGSRLSSENLRGNLMLRQTIDEWFRRNAKIRIQQATSTLSDGSATLEKIEEALDGVLKTFDEGPGDRYTLSRSGLVPLVIELWKRKIPDNSHVRSKALLLMLNAVTDDTDAQEMLAEAGALKFAVRSMSSDLVNEVENSLKLVYEMSKRPSIARRLGNLKGAIIHLLAIASNSSGNASLSLLAEKTLKNLETMDDNVQQMAEAGRFEPLFARLCNGPETTQVQMAKFLADKRFVDLQRDHAARKAANVLVDMLSGSPTAKQASMVALSNLSKLQDNVLLLVKAGILPPLVHAMFSDDVATGFKDAAAETLASIVSVPGSWEDAPIDQRNNRLHSKAFLHQSLDLMSSISQGWNSALLHIFIGVLSSSHAADSAARSFVSGNGINVLLALVEQTGDLHLLQVLKLLGLLSERIGTEMVFPPKWLTQLKSVLLRDSCEESIYAAAILSNIKLSEADIAGTLGSDVLTWCISWSRKLGSGSARLNSAMLEGLTGLLVQFARCSDEGLVNTMKQQRLMELFCVNLQVHGQAMTKQRAAMGLVYLCQKSWQPVTTTPKERWGWVRAFCMSHPTTEQELFCPLHKVRCMPGESFCLVEANAIRPLVDLLEDEERQVQLAAVEALSTLVLDQWLEAGVNELNKAGGTGAVVKWFQTVRLSTAAQERGVYLIERILRVEEQARKFSLDQGLVMLLVEVFKRGSRPARRTAEAALAHTNMLSVVTSQVRDSNK